MEEKESQSPHMGVGGRTSQAISNGERAEYQDVKSRLERLYKRGEKYTSLFDLAELLGCGKTMVYEIIKESGDLKKWKDKALKDRKANLRVTGLSPVITDNIPQDTEPDPADALTENDVDTGMARLIEQAEPKEQAGLKALDAAKRRKIVCLHQEQEKDNRQSKVFKR